MATFYGGYNQYLEDLSSSGGSIYAALQGGEIDKQKKIMMVTGIIAAIVLGLNIYMYNSAPASSSGRQRRSRRQ